MMLWLNIWYCAMADVPASQPAVPNIKLWLNIWYCAMAGGFFLFAALAVTVGFGAFRDVHMMLMQLRRKHTQEKRLARSAEDDSQTTSSRPHDSIP